MKPGGHSRIVIVTCANVVQARRIAGAAVEKRLAACGNILGGSIESIYRWKGHVEKAREVLLLLKTTTPRLTELEREVKRLHTYEVPEFIALPILAGSAAYLRWIRESVSRQDL